MTAVCLITQEFPPDTAWGGIATYAAHLADGLVRAGCSVTVISRSMSGAESREDRGDLLVWRIPNTVRPSALPNFLARPLAVRRALRTIERPFDVIEYPSWTGEAAFIPRSAARILAVRLVTTVRTAQRYSKTTLKQRAAAPILHRLESVAVRRANVRMSGTDDHARSSAAEFGVPRESIAVVPLGIPLPRERPPSGEPVVLIVGRLEPRKGTEIALRAASLVAAAMPEARFVFAGQVGRDLRGVSYRDLVARDSTLTACVTLLGRVDAASLARLREESGVIVVPSLAESFGLTYLEAMAAGRALVAFDIPAARELLASAGIPLVPPTAEALAGELLDLLSDAARCRRVGEIGRALVRERYSVERMVADTLSAYGAVT